MEFSMKKALITGITGQDGSYLTELLIRDGYEVHGIMRRASVFTTERIEHLLDNPKLVLHHGDLNDSSNLTSLVSSILPDEIYHLGAQSHVGVSFEVPEYTGDVVGLGTLRLLNAIKSSGKQIKFYNAATSEMFGGLPETAPQSEATPFHPKSPYGAAKLYSFWLTVNYREAFGLFASNGILFNHESPRRGQTFVTRKISLAAARISKTNEGELVLGNLDAVRDWGFAGDYVKAMRAMLSQDSPDDFVIATGRSATVREFASMAFLCAGIELSWQGSGVDEVGIDSKSGKKIVRVSERYYRPSEVDVLIGDSTKAERILGWKPELDLEGLVKLMVESDLQNV
jgi:GDPmannose 4,6-dehydratase